MARKLGYFLKQKRGQLLLFQEQAADKIGISRVRYSDMERDKVYSYDPNTLKKVADFLGESTDFVLAHLPKKPRE